MKIVEIKVQGDSGEVYTVSAANADTPVCSCPAFFYRPETPCKHMKYLVALTHSS